MTSPEWPRYSRALPSIAAAVGRTPLVRLNRITEDVTPAIYVKVEWYGATGSLKDRIYLHMFERALARGDLKPGMRVLECSTGNAGIACAWVAAVKGYACTIVMPEGMSEERKKIMRAYGALLVFTKGGESDVDLSLQKLGEIRAADPARYWVPGQFDNTDNVEAHILTTGPEMREQMDGRIGAFVDSQGSGALLTGVITTTTEDSVAIARRLAKEEGIFCGISSGCNVAAALKLARRHPELPSIVTIINDTGQRYFTTPLCGEAKTVDIPDREHPMDEHTASQLDRFQSRWEILT